MVFPLLGAALFPVLRLVDDIVQALFLALLGDRLSQSSAEGRTAAVAIEFETSRAGAIDVASGLVIRLSTVCAAILHIVP